MRDKRILCGRPMYVLERGYRYHWFEGGFRLNMEFIKWKLKFYWEAISALWSKENRWLDILFLPVYLIVLALQLCYMPYDIVKTVFITHAIKSQEQYLYEYKLRNFGIHDPRNVYDLYGTKQYEWLKNKYAGKFK